MRELRSLQEVTINLNGHHLTAADPLTPEAEEILTALSIPTGHEKLCNSGRVHHR